MVVNNVQVLTFNESLLGLRIHTSEGVFDADLQSLRKIGVMNINIDSKSTLYSLGDLLVSKEEQEDGLVTVDISDNEEILNKLRPHLEESPFSHELFTLQLPHEMPLKVFMEDEDWVAVRVNRKDEHKNQHNLIQPDGKSWRYGWIGSARSPYLAKENFHKEQVYWSIHKGKTIKEEVLSDYPDLKEVHDKITEVQEGVKIWVEDYPLFSLVVDGHELVFPVSLFPLGNRLGSREFVRTNGLISEELKSFSKLGRTWDGRELTLIAITKAMYGSNILKEVGLVAVED